MFLEIFCLGSLASVLFNAGKATSGSLSRKNITAANKYDDDEYDEIDIKKLLKCEFDESKRFYVFRAYKHKDMRGTYHAILRNDVDDWGTIINTETMEELNNEIEREYKEQKK